MINATRLGTFQKVRNASQMVIHIDSSMRNVINKADDYLVGKLPPNCVISDATAWVIKGTDLGNISVGTTEGGSDLLGSALVTSSDETEIGTFGGTSLTGTGKDVYIGTASGITQGELVVIITYFDYTKATGELTSVE